MNEFDTWDKPQAVQGALGLASDLGRSIQAAARLDQAEKAYLDLRQLAQSNPNDQDVRRLHAIGMLDLLRKRPAAATDADRDLLAESQALMAAHPDESILRVCHVHMAWEFMAKAPSNTLHEGAVLHKRQMELYERCEDVRDHAEPIVLSKMKLMTDHLINGDLGAARTLYDEIVAMALRHPDERGVQYARCGSAHNLISHLVTADDRRVPQMDIAQGYFSELKAFIDASPFRLDLIEILDEASALFD